MDAPVSYARAELTVKGSRFLSELFPLTASATVQQDVRARLKSQKATHADATHVVHAFIAGAQAEVMGMSDDGEPGGTAGRPVLDVLRGRGATNLLVTVTRWFGGTLLGTGGLVHAYGDAAKLVLDAAELVPLLEKRAFSLTASYADYELLRRLFAAYTLFDLHEDFAETVTVAGTIAADDATAFATLLHEKTNARVNVLFPAPTT